MKTIILKIEVPDDKPCTAIGEVGLVVMGATSFEVIPRPTDEEINKRFDFIYKPDQTYYSCDDAINRIRGARWLRSLIWGDTE